MLSGAPVRIAALMACAAVVWWRWPPRENGATPDQLAEAALHAPTSSEQTAAAVKLADYGPPALVPLRRVVAESAEPAVKAVCVEGLAKLWDYDSMNLLLDLAESGSPLVRGRAAQVVMQMTGRHRPYYAEASPGERRTLVRHMRADWREIQQASAADRDELKRRLRESYDQQL